MTTLHWTFGSSSPTRVHSARIGERLVKVLPQRGAGGVQFAKSVVGERGKVHLVSRVEPAGARGAQREDAEFGREARRWLEHSSFFECGSYRCRQANTFERFSFLEFAAGHDRCVHLWSKVSSFGREGASNRVESPGDSLQWCGGRGRCRDALFEEPAQGVLPGEQHFALVREMAEERALRQARPLGDLGHGRGTVTLLVKEVECRTD